MLSLLGAIWTWLADSANLLLDLANAGRDAENAVVIAITATLAVIRVTALLVIVVPAAVWLWNLVYQKAGKDREARVRVIVIVLIILSVVFEIWASPARKSDVDADNVARIEAGVTYGD